VADSHDSAFANPAFCRLASAEDIPKLEHLLCELGGDGFLSRLGGRTVSEFCHWKYFQNPAGDAVIGVAVDGDRVVSLAAGVPKQVQVHSKICLALELGDFITDVSYRRRGLFSHIIELICNEGRKLGAAFAYVRPNENSFPILVSRLGFQEVARISERRYVLPSTVLQRKLGLPGHVAKGFGLDALVRYFVLPTISEGIKIVAVESFGSDADEMAEKLRPNLRFCVSRHSKYLNWRYSDSPTPYRIWLAYRENALCGYLVELREFSAARGWIADLFCAEDDDAVATSLVRTCMQSMFDDGIQTVSTWVAAGPDQSAAARTLTRAFPRIGDAGLHFVVRPLQEDFTTSSLPPSGWRLAMGDFDGI